MQRKNKRNKYIFLFFLIQAYTTKPLSFNTSEGNTVTFRGMSIFCMFTGWHLYAYLTIILISLIHDTFRIMIPKINYHRLSVQQIHDMRSPRQTIKVGLGKKPFADRHNSCSFECSCSQVPLVLHRKRDMHLN